MLLFSKMDMDWTLDAKKRSQMLAQGLPHSVCINRNGMYAVHVYDELKIGAEHPESKNKIAIS